MILLYFYSPECCKWQRKFYSRNRLKEAFSLTGTEHWWSQEEEGDQLGNRAQGSIPCPSLAVPHSGPQTSHYHPRLESLKISVCQETGPSLFLDLHYKISPELIWAVVVGISPYSVGWIKIPAGVHPLLLLLRSDWWETILPRILWFNKF